MFPRVPLHEDQRAEEDEGTVHPFGAPYPLDGELVYDGGEQDVEDVEYEHAGFHEQGEEGVAGARDELEIDHGCRHDEGAYINIVKHRHRLCGDDGVVGVDGRDLHGEYRKQDEDGQQGEDRHLEDAAQGSRHLVGFLRAYQAAGHRVGGGAVGKHRQRAEQEDTAPDAGNGHGLLPEMLDEGEEQEPGPEGEKPLQHGGQRDFQDGGKQFRLEFLEVEEMVLLVWQPEECVGDKGDKGGDFRQHRREARTGHAHLGEAEVPEDEGVVEEDVHRGHHQRGDGDDLGVGKSDVQGPEQVVHTHEDDAPLPEVHELEGGGEDVRGLDNVGEKAGGERFEDEKEK